MTRENTRIKTYILVLLSLFCLGARSIKDKIVFSEVRVSDNGSQRKLKVYTVTRGFDTYYHLKGLCSAYDISFSYVPAKKRILLSRGVNSFRLTIGAEPKLKNYFIFSDTKYFLSAEGLNYVFAGLMKGSVKADKKNKMLVVTYETLKKPAVTVKPVKPASIIPGMRTIPVLKGEKFEVERIVLDAGHGGKDPGAVGKKGLQEKQVTLDVALLTAKLIKAELKKEVILTRTKDEYVSLQERVGIANKNKGDIFVSIHINANTDRDAMGTEVYIYSAEATDKKSSSLAYRENLEYKKVGGITSILAELGSKSNDYLSILLAGNVLDNIMNYVDVASRNKSMILRAPFYVIAHSDMPSVLVEVAFITNTDEERKLRESEFRNNVARAITYGIKDFINATGSPDQEIEPAALMVTPENEKKGGYTDQ